MTDLKFARIQCPCGEIFQVLVLDETGKPVDWDEVATARLYQAHVCGGA